MTLSRMHSAYRDARVRGWSVLRAATRRSAPPSVALPLDGMGPRQWPSGAAPHGIGRHALRGFRSIVLVGLAGWLLSAALYQACAQTGLADYRSAMRDLVSTLRVMQSRALLARRTVQLRIDASRGVLQLAAVQGRAPYETLERTMWLPKALEISEAPPVLTALPGGELVPASIIVTAPSHNRRFRLTINEAGRVELYEEPTL